MFKPPGILFIMKLYAWLWYLLKILFVFERDFICFYLVLKETYFLSELLRIYVLIYRNHSCPLIFQEALININITSHNS